MQDKEPQPKLLLTPREAAKMLSISERTLWTLTKNGILRVKRIGRAVRYSLTVLTEYVASSDAPS